MTFVRTVRSATKRRQHWRNAHRQRARREREKPESCHPAWSEYGGKLRSYGLYPNLEEIEGLRSKGVHVKKLLRRVIEGPEIVSKHVIAAVPRVGVRIS